jgi:hypothetical protein
LKSKLAGHIQKPVEIVIFQNLSGVFDFSSLQDQEIVGKKDQIHNKFWIFKFSLPLSDALMEALARPFDQKNKNKIILCV